MERRRERKAERKIDIEREKGWDKYIYWERESTDIDLTGGRLIKRENDWEKEWEIDKEMISCWEK